MSQRDMSRSGWFQRGMNWSTNSWQKYELVSPTSILQSSAKELTKPLAATAAQCQFGTVVENHSILVVEPRLQFAHAIDVHDRRPVNARKLLRIKLSFHAADRFTKQIRLLAYVKPNVLTFGLDPIDFFGLQKESAAAGFDNQPLHVIGSRLELFQERECLLAEIIGAFIRETRLGASKSFLKPRAIERLHKIVDRRYLKRS